MLGKDNLHQSAVGERSHCRAIAKVDDHCLVPDLFKGHIIQRKMDILNKSIGSKNKLFASAIFSNGGVIADADGVGLGLFKV